MRVEERLHESWLNLRNAMIARAIYDYEMLISDAPVVDGADMIMSEMTIPSIRAFFSGTERMDWIKKIDRIYHEEFRPYALKHANEIKSRWKKHMALKTDYERDCDLKVYPHKCPLCGGAMKPVTICGLKFIGCNFCYLNVQIPEWRGKKCIT